MTTNTPNPTSREEKLEEYMMKSSLSWWKDYGDPVRSIDFMALGKSVSDLLAQERASTEQRMREILERLKLKIDVVVCDCGEPYKESDLADMINQALNELKGDAGK